MYRRIWLICHIGFSCLFIFTKANAQTNKGDVGISSESISLPDSMLATLRVGHPRLMVSSLKDFDDLKNRIPRDTFLTKVYRHIKMQADDLLTIDVAPYHIEPQLGGQMLEVSRTVYRRVYILAMTYRLTKEKKYADRAWKELLSASQFPDWNPWHFLDVSEMAHGFAIGYDWLYDIWTPEQRKVIRQAIVDKALLRAYLAYHGMESRHLVDWPKAVNNWNQVVNGSMCMAALAVGDEEPLLCNYILKESVKRLPAIMKRLEPDGASEEGPGYWKFGIQYNVAAIQSLETALGTDFGLSKFNGFSKTGSYFLSMAGIGGRAFNYADCWTDTIRSAELLWFARRYNQPLLAKYQMAHPDFVPLELLWYDGAPESINNLPLNNYYRFCEVATMRSSWEDSNGWFIGFKGGHNQANHGHLDIGDFVLDKGGKRWAVDYAHDSYALPGYFDVTGQRWTYYRMKAEGHNTLVLNPDKNPDQDLKAFSKILRFVTKPDRSFGIIDMTPAYPEKVFSAQRGIQLQEKRRVIIQDEITATKNITDLYWFMQTSAQISISKDKKKATLSIDDQKLQVEIAGEVKAHFEVLEAKPLPSSAQPAGGDTNEQFRRLTIHLKNVKKTIIRVVFKEVGDAERLPLQPLTNW